MTDNAADLSDDIVPKEPQHAAIERDFAPWHKVRKEYVRKEQWNKFVIRYAVRFLRHELQNADEDNWSADTDVQIPDTVKIDHPLAAMPSARTKQCPACWSTLDAD